MPRVVVSSVCEAGIDACTAIRDATGVVEVLSEQQPILWESREEEQVK